MRVQVEVHLEGYFEGPSAVQVELEGQFGEPVQVALGGQFERPSGVQVALGGQFEGPSGVQVALGGHFEGPSEVQVALGGHSDGFQVRLGWPKRLQVRLQRRPREVQELRDSSPSAIRQQTAPLCKNRGFP